MPNVKTLPLSILSSGLSCATLLATLRLRVHRRAFVGREDGMERGYREPRRTRHLRLPSLSLAGTGSPMLVYAQPSCAKASIGARTFLAFSLALEGGRTQAARFSTIEIVRKRAPVFAAVGESPAAQPREQPVTVEGGGRWRVFTIPKAGFLTEKKI